jgi:pyruvate/2-oxoacid:ferredoxin oxidoreductase alpha subunit
MAKQKKFLTCDGNQAVAIYPITPSSTMTEYVDEMQPETVSMQAGTLTLNRTNSENPDKNKVGSNKKLTI